MAEQGTVVTIDAPGTDDDGLTAICPPRGQLSWGLAGFWKYRNLVYLFVWRDTKVRYKQTVLGAAWAFLQPFLTMVVFTLVFGRLAKVPSGGRCLSGLRIERSPPLGSCLLTRWFGQATAWFSSGTC